MLIFYSFFQRVFGFKSTLVLFFLLIRFKFKRSLKINAMPRVMVQIPCEGEPIIFQDVIYVNSEK